MGVGVYGRGRRERSPSSRAGVCVCTELNYAGYRRYRLYRQPRGISLEKHCIRNARAQIKEKVYFSRLKRHHLVKKKSTLAPTQFIADRASPVPGHTPEDTPRTHPVFSSVHSLSTAEVLAAAVPKGKGSCGSGGRGRETPV